MIEQNIEMLIKARAEKEYKAALARVKVFANNELNKIGLAGDVRLTTFLGNAAKQAVDMPDDVYKALSAKIVQAIELSFSVPSDLLQESKEEVKVGSKDVGAILDQGGKSESPVIAVEDIPNGVAEMRELAEKLGVKVVSATGEKLGKPELKAALEIAVSEMKNEESKSVDSGSESESE